MGKYEQDNDTTNGAEPIEWIVVANNGNEAMLLTKAIIEYMPFHSSTVATSYRDTTLRNWLIGEFYQGTFTTEEKARIVEPHLLVTASTNGRDYLGDSNKVFIPSREHYENMIANNVDISTYATEFVSVRLQYSNVDVWMRGSPEGRQYYTFYKGGDGLYNESYILYYDTPGTYGWRSNSPTYKGGVRPAIWVKIGE